MRTGTDAFTCPLCGRRDPFDDVVMPVFDGPDRHSANGSSNAQRRVKAWVRFGPESIRVDAKLVRSTPLAAGIEFKADGQTLRCWVWRNAVRLADD